MECFWDILTITLTTGRRGKHYKISKTTFETCTTPLLQPRYQELKKWKNWNWREKTRPDFQG